MAASEIIGAPLDRVDGRAKVTGAARYAAEFKAPALLHAFAVQSPIASGRVVAVDARDAQRAAGVAAVLTHEQLPKLAVTSSEDKQGRPGATFIPMQGDEIRYAGQYVALVLADTLARARHAASLVKVRYAGQPAKTWDMKSDAAAGGAIKPRVVGRDDKPDSLRGDPDAAIAAAPTVVRQSYFTAQENHNPMELSAAVAYWNDGKLTFYTTTQWMDGSRHVLAHAFGISEEMVHTICPFVGGGFGCKGNVWPHEFLTAAAARVVGRPVKFVLTRPEMFVGCGCRPMIRQDIALAAGADGQLAAMTHDVTNHTSVSDPWAESAAKQTRMLYTCPNVRTAHRLVAVNASTPCQMRAPGHAPGTWALEVAMDELASALKMDPLELRLKNYAARDEDEDKPFSSKALRECYAQGAERFGWSRRVAAPGTMRDGRYQLGWGMATATYPANRQKAAARVRLLLDGTALVTSATHDLGTGTYTIMTQLAAETLGLPVERVRFDLGDSDYPESPVAGGSQTAASVGCAVKAACLRAREALFAAVSADGRSPLTGRPPGAMVLDNGRLLSAGVSEQSESLADFLRRRGTPIDVTAEAEPGEKKFSTHSFGAQFAEVRIDADLGEIRVSRVVGAFAAGRVLNAKTAHSQVMGGIVMGIGMALLEGTHYDPKRFKIVNDNLADYLVPVNPDIHEIDCFFVDEPDPNINEIGAKGLGELGITGIAAAVTNAVYHAMGRRIRELPIRVNICCSQLS